MSETVRIEFDPPRECQETEKAWRLYAEGEDCLSLPKSQTLELERDGKMVRAVIVTRWLAEKKGLVSSSFYEPESYQEQTPDSMSRNDWITLGLAMAMVIRGESNSDVVWEARKLALKLQEES